jgi:hypothetical protein
MISRSTSIIAPIYNALEPLPRLFNSFDERLSDDIEIPGEIFREFFWLFEPRGKDVFSDPSFESTQRLRGSFGQSQAVSSARNLALPATRSFCRNLRSVTGIKANCMGIWMLTTR